MEQKKKRTQAEIRRNKRKMQNAIRRIIQILFFFGMPSLFSEAFSGVKGIFRAVGSGDVIGMNQFIRTFLILSAITIMVGRYFCGYACAFGALGDFVFGIRKGLEKKCKVKFPKLSHKLAKRLQIIKYVELLVLLGMCVYGTSGLIEQNSPWQTFSRLRMLDVRVADNWIGFLIFVCILVGMFWEERFFCQFLCPLGAIFSLLPIFPWAVLKRDTDNCIKGCNACQNQCPVHVKVNGVQLSSNECISCGRCRGVCPKKNIAYRIRQKG